MYRGEIVYNSETHEYDVYLDSKLVGSAHTYLDAAVMLDQLIFELVGSDDDNKGDNEQ